MIDSTYSWLFILSLYPFFVFSCFFFFYFLFSGSVQQTNLASVSFGVHRQISYHIISDIQTDIRRPTSRQKQRAIITGHWLTEQLKQLQWSMSTASPTCQVVVLMTHCLSACNSTHRWDPEMTTNVVIIVVNVDWVKASRSTQNKMGHFGNILLSQSLWQY